MSYPERDSLRPAAPLLALLCAGHFLAFFDRQLLSAASPLIKTEFSLSDHTIGWVQGSVLAAAYVIASLVFARLPTTMRRPLLPGGVLLWTAGEAGLALARNLGELTMAQAMVGIGQAAFIPLALSLVATAPRRTGTALSLFTASSSVGRSASVLGAGLMLTALSALHVGGSWRALYVIVALFGAALLAPLAANIPGTVIEAAPASRGGLARYGQSYGMIVAMTLPVMLLLQAIAAWMPTLCVRAYGLTAAQAATLVGAVTVVTAPLGQLLGGRLHDRVPGLADRPYGFMLSCTAIASVSVGMFGVAARPAEALAGLAIANLALGIASFTGLATLQRLVAPSDRARVNALFLALVTTVGLGAGPVLAGALSDWGGADARALADALIGIAIGTAALCVLVAVFATRSGGKPAPCLPCR